MSLINFFGKIIKPKKLKGTGTLHPASTSIIDSHLSCIRQDDVNLWFYRKGEHLIAFDTGYENFPDMDKEFEKIQVNPLDVEHVFLTHADMDHAGGMSDKATSLFPNAKIYLHQEEVEMLKGEAKRFVFGPISFKNPISKKEGYLSLTDGQVIHIGPIQVEIIHTPGHTPGHSCYLVDETLLITGDCLAINESGGYGFFHFFNMDTKTNMNSLQKLKGRFENNPPRIICTGHSGYHTCKENYFRHVDKVAFGSKKNPFDPKAPRDVFKK